MRLTAAQARVLAAIADERGVIGVSTGPPQYGNVVLAEREGHETVWVWDDGATDPQRWNESAILTGANRKPHVRRAQREFLAYVRERGEASLGEIAGALDVSDGTARRHLDGLVHQGLLTVTATPGRRAYFARNEN